MSHAIEIRGVRKSFGHKLAVDALDLVVPHGTLCGFIGPNGAGKTTTIRMIMSILFPDQGEIRVLGADSALRSKDRIGYLPEERGVYKKMRVGAFLVYIARLKGIDAGEARRRSAQWLERVGLEGAGKKRCEELSKGMQQKVQFIAAVLHEPELLILDEVFSGLDPVNRRLMRELIEQQHAGGRTIVFSTHAMVEAEALCDQIVMIHQGRKVLDAPLTQVLAQGQPRAVLYEPVGEPDVAALSALPGVRGVEHAPGRGVSRGVIELKLDDGADPQGVMAGALRCGAARRVELRRASLEDIFIQRAQSLSGQSVDASVLQSAAGGGED